MTLIVIEFLEADDRALFQDESLETTQYLLAQGCYGEVASPTIEPAPASLWDLLLPVIERSHHLVIAHPAADAWEQAAGRASSGACDYLHVDLARATQAELAEDDAHLATLLSRLHADDVLALVAGRRYAIVAANNPLHGATPAMTLPDLAMTLLALDDRPRPDGITGNALFSDPATIEADEEAELRERFRGLGYIA